MRGALAAVLLLLALAGPALAQHPMIVGVAPKLPDGDAEGFALGSGTRIDLAGYRVTDGEGVLTLPTGTLLEPGKPIWFTNDASGWSAFGGPTATSYTASQLVLANGGDQLRLLAPDGSEADAMAYGDKSTPGSSGELSYTSAGLVYLRDRDPVSGAWLDTDSARDWQTPREHRIGQSALDEPTWTVERITLFSSPDSSHATLTALVAASSQRLHLHVYELRSATLTDALVQAKQDHPALDLQVLVDANPVGMTAPERHATTDALSRIQAAGGHVVLAGNGRYDDWHQKVLVADDAVAVMSENWVDSGIPPVLTTGNRGWGVVLHDKAAADWFAAMMAADRAGWDIRPFDAAAFDPLFDGWDRPAAPREGAYGPAQPARTLEGAFRVTPVVAPDHAGDPRTDPIAARIGAAHGRVIAQHLDLALGARNDLGWHGDDAWYEALKGAAERGVPTRVQLAAPFAADDHGNADALAALASHGAATATMERPGIAALHNKGFVLDDAVVVGSMNGNHHSRSSNREVDVVIEGKAVADAFADLFDADWQPAEAPRDWDVIGEDLKGVPGLAPVPIVMVLVGVAWSRRWS